MINFKLSAAKLWLTVGLLVLGCYFGLAQAANLTLSQQPLTIVQQGIDPNILFLMDDTDQMQSEWLGTTVQFQYSGNQFTFGDPQGGGGIYGSNGQGANLNDVIPGFGVQNQYGAEFRSSFFNNNYYNPAVTYIPWACPAPYPESPSQTGIQSATQGKEPCQWWSDASFKPDGGIWVMPDATPTSAWLNPETDINGTGGPTRDLEVINSLTSGNPSSGTTNGFSGDSSTTWVICSSAGTNACGAYKVESGSYPTITGSGFWPAVYWNYIGPTPATATDQATMTNYEQVQICPSSTTTGCTLPDASTTLLTSIGLLSSGVCPVPGMTYIGDNGDYIYITGISQAAINTTNNPCGVTMIMRTYQQEIQNFANWYTFYRSRISMARAGGSLAFMQLPPDFRVDFSTVSQMTGTSNPVTVTATEPFTFASGNRTGLLSAFNKQNVNNNQTPLRTALQGVGKWMQGNAASSAPWGSSIAESKANGNNKDLSCRANYTILVSADYWNGDGPGLGNVDGSSGPQITTPTSYQYSPGPPYQDTVDNTLADVAQYYWENDLQPTMTNDVPTNSEDPAYWQHLVTFTIGMGEVPQLVQDYMQNYAPGDTEAQAQSAVMTLIKDGDLHWPDGTAEPNAPSGVTNPPFGATYSAPDSNQTTDADDLWHAAVDGHGSFLSAQNPTSFEEALMSALDNILNRNASGASVATNTQKAGQVRTDTQVYQALYHPSNWWGELLAEPVNITNGVPSIGSTDNWDASCVLTGGTCPTPVMNPPASAESTSIPVFLTYSNTAGGGILFNWSSLSSKEQAWLNGPDGYGSQRLAYLKGSPVSTLTCGSATCPFRSRTSILGDIVHSSPVWVGYELNAYPTSSNDPLQTTWEDDLYTTFVMPENSGTSYQTFENNTLNRLNMVYVGSNDGMLRGFESGSYYSSGTSVHQYDSTFNDGKELLAYVPRAVYKNLDTYTMNPYGRNQHHYYVDASPGTGDVFYNGNWHTWLADGLGAGGRDLFVLDINSPGTVGTTTSSGTTINLCPNGGTPSPSCFSSYAPANTQSSTNLVRADWTGSYMNAAGTLVNGNLTCVNDANCAKDLGDTFGTPEIRRFHNGDWGIIWGNGYNSVNGEAGIFIGLINHSATDPTAVNGGITVYWLGTNGGSANTDPTGAGRPDGIAYVNTADLDGDHVVDYAYAGDLFGNVWRFDLTSQDPSNWHVSCYAGSTTCSQTSTGTPLFKAVNSAGVPQPITTQIQVVRIPSGITNPDPVWRLMVLFGTGKLLEPADAAPNTTANGVQSLYGIWDGGLATWNTMSAAFNMQNQYVTWSGMASINRSELLQQSITSEQYSTNSSGTLVGLRETSQYPVQWADLTYGGVQGTQYGWYLDLVSPAYGYQGEMVIYNPSIKSGVFTVNTTILGQPTLTCGTNDNGGWSMGLDPSDGAMLTFNAFAIQNMADYSGAFTKSGALNGIYSGVTVGAVGSPAYLTLNGKTYMVISTASGTTKLVQTGFGSAPYNERLSWRELR